MKEMFEASVDGQPYDMERWGVYFKPRGVQFVDTATTATDSAATPAPAAPAAPAAATVVAESAPVVTADEDEAVIEAASPVVVPTPGSGSQRAEDILALIRNRQKTA